MSISCSGSFLGVGGVQHAGNVAMLLYLFRGQGKAASLKQVETQPPIAHRREGVGLEEQLHDQQQFCNAAMLLDHRAELARQHGDGEPLRVNPRMDGPLLELIHNVRDADFPGAFHGAGVAGGAEPDGVTLEDLVLEVTTSEGHDLAGRIIHVDAQGTYSGTGAALDAALQLLAPRNAHDLFAETFDSVRIVLNRALYFHHKSLRRICSAPVISRREADDISSCSVEVNENSQE